MPITTTGRAEADPWRIGLPLMAVAGLWSWFQFFEDTQWTFPLLRGAVLAGAAGLALLLAAPDRNLRLCAALAACVTALACGVLLLAGARSSKLEVVLAAMLCAVPFGLRALGSVGHNILALWNRHLLASVVAVGLLVLGVRLLSFALGLSYPHLIDIGQTTLDALNTTIGGHNPYAAGVDYNTPDPLYKGYKYLPAMMAIYAPLGLPFGVAGVRVTNLLLDAATILLTAALALRLGGHRLAVAIAVAAYALMPTGIDLFRHGVTDLASVVPMLAALLLVDRRPAWAGFAAGLAVSVKLFPGLLAVICCFPAAGRWRYVLGVCAGLLPCAWFFAGAPAEFVENIFIFNAVRPPDATSISGTLPRIGALALKLAAVGIVATFGLALLLRRNGLALRCAFLMTGTVLALLSGPVLHNNYMLWWLPVFCALLAVAAAGPAEAGKTAAK